MKKTLFTLFTFITCFTGISQELGFSELGSEPAYCRLFGYQNGNGVVYASATGGTPDYSYLWEYLETGVTTTSSTWGGRNPGNYQITITDAMGTTISETFYLDSLNIAANFDPFSDNLSEDCIGFAPDTIGFVNLSENYENPNNPLADPRFFWNFDAPSGEYLITDNTDNMYKGYLYGGEFLVCLVAQNKNGCADTICKSIGLFGSLIGVEENASSDLVTLTPNINNNELVVSNGESDVVLKLNLYTVNGKLIHTEPILNANTSIPFYYGNGIYLYEFIDDQGQSISSGKFNF
jgi:hypothetical protein